MEENAAAPRILAAMFLPHMHLIDGSKEAEVSSFGAPEAEIQLTVEALPSCLKAREARSVPVPSWTSSIKVFNTSMETKPA